MEEKLGGETSEFGSSDVAPSFSSETLETETGLPRRLLHPPEHELETARQFVGPLEGMSDRRLLSLLMQLGMLIKGERGFSEGDTELKRAGDSVGSAIKVMKRRVSNVECTVLT